MTRRISLSLLVLVVMLAAGPNVIRAQRYSISGTINVEGRSDHSGIIVWVDAMHSDVTGPTGDFEIRDVQPGTYDLQAWAPHCLSEIIMTVHVSLGDLSGARGSLFPGDVHQDGRINLLDGGEILGAIYSTPDSVLWDPVLDLDGNSVIDSLDLVLLIDHWKEEDEVDVPAWQIAVFEPGSEDIWWLGQQGVVINWTTANLGGDVSIYLLLAGTVVDTITQSTPNDGEFQDYIVPTDLMDSGGYSVVVRAEDPIAGVSENFAVRQAIVISNPDSSDYWSPGGYAQINWWNRVGSTSPVSLYLYKGDELRYTIVEGRQYDLEFYDWTTPADAETGDDYRVKASYDDTPWIAAFSDHFDIRPRFQVLQPTWLTNWYQGQENVSIRWRPAELGGVVSIRLLRGDAHIDMIAVDTPNDGHYDEYDVPFDIEPGGSYRVQVYYDETFNAASAYFDIATVPDAHNMNDVSMSGPDIATIVGDFGMIMRTTDSGSSWYFQDSGTYNDLTAVSFLDDSFGTAVGKGGIVLQTSDGGVSWARQESGVSKILRDVCRIDLMNITAVGENGLVIHSDNGGASWEIQQSGTVQDLHGVDFSTSTEGCAVGAHGTIITTDDAGETWTVRESGTSALLLDVDFIQGSIGATVGYFGQPPESFRNEILMTSDGGITWSLKYFLSMHVGTLLADNFRGIAVLDEFRVIQTGGIFHRSVDGGETWTRTNVFEEFFRGVDFGDDNTGMAVSYESIIRSIDGGATWQRLESP